MLRWEYAVVKAKMLGGWEIITPERSENRKGNIIEILNSLGEAGWELVSTTHYEMGNPHTLLLKRSRG